MGTALVVEDCLTEREILSTFLKGAGLNVMLATSGEEALEQISQSLPDVIVLDIVLPGRSGFEICRELKAAEETSGIPIVLCSTKGSDMDKFWGMKQGADAYLSKPVDQEELIRTIKQFL